MGLLRTIAFILIGYFLLRLISRWMAPMVLGYAARKAEKRFREMYGHKYEQKNGGDQPVGHVSVDKKTKNHKGNSERVGDYIEFEEIE